jgi:hypothetical protein
MMDVIFPKRAPAPRERDTRPVPSDYRPKPLRALSAGVESDSYYDDPGASLLEATAVNLHKLEDELLNRNRLDEIAALVRSLTYGEMMQLAQAIWKIRPEDAGTVDQTTLPVMLHRWSTASSADGEPEDDKVQDLKAAE